MVFMRTRVGRRNPHDEQGAIAVLTAILMVVLILCAAIVVDLGNARDVQSQSQNAADAASLAGANVLYPATGICRPPLLGAGPCITDAVAAVKSYATDNFQVSDTDWQLPACQTVVPLSYLPDPSNKCISLDSATSPTLVRVYMPIRTAPVFFGGIIHSSSIPVGSSAQALVRQAVTCSLCFLGNVDAGNGDLTVIGGTIAVNGNVTDGPNSYWTATSIGVVGTWDTSGHPSVPVTKIPAFGDPMAGLALPLNTTGLSAKTDPCGATTATGGTGIYNASLSVGNNVTCTLLPGLYVISNSWSLGNHSLLLGTGVTLYVKGPSGVLHFKNGDAIFTAPLTAPLTGVPAGNNVPAGYAIIYDRDNVNPVELQGNGTTLITGKVYAAASKLDFNGTTCFGFSGGPFIFGSGYTNGNTSCVIVSNSVSTTVIPALLHLNQ
jgi:hypothetical protein